MAHPTKCEAQTFVTAVPEFMLFVIKSIGYVFLTDFIVM